MNQCPENAVFNNHCSVHSFMEASFDKTGKTTKMKYTGSVDALLKKLGINKETVIVVRGDELLTEHDEISDKDKVRIISVVSGG